MSWERWLFAFAVVLFAAVYYGLALLALRDLSLRPSVRGENKAVWGLLILCLPIAGALIYGYAGPSGFLPRKQVFDGAPSTQFDELLAEFDSRTGDKSA